MLNNTTNDSFFTIHFSLFTNCTKKLPISSIIITLEMDSSESFFIKLHCVLFSQCFSFLFIFCFFFIFTYLKNSLSNSFCQDFFLHIHIPLFLLQQRHLGFLFFRSIGIFTFSSTCSNISSEIPFASFPMITAVL